MTRQEVARLARELMDQHLTRNPAALVKGLYGWTFKFNSDKTRLGVCRFKTKSIELSIYHADFSTADNIRNTILHEIAHAMVGPKHGHDWTWKCVARMIGCTGERCGTLAGGAVPDVLKRQAAYIGTCAVCACEIPRYRKSKRVESTTSWHVKCGKRGLITWRKAA